MWFAMVSAALACAGLVHEVGELAESASSEAVFEVFDGEAEVTYEVTYEGDAADFGWIVPVPGDVLSVADGDEERLASFRQLTQPQVYREEEHVEEAGGCFGRKSNAKGGDEVLRDSEAGNVEVLAEGFTGTYGYVVVSADDADALQDWADDAGWSLGGVTSDLQHYLDLGDAVVLLDLHADDGVTEGPRALPPVTIRYDSEALRFPSVMARSAGEAQRTTVYVVGDSRGGLVDGWTHQDVDELEGSGDPSDIFEDELAALGADRSWARVWSGSVEGRHLTRFDLSADAALHDRDAVFGFDGTDQAQSLGIYTYGGSQAWVLFPLGLLFLVGRRS